MSEKDSSRPPFLPHLLVLAPLVLAVLVAGISWFVPMEVVARVQAIWSFCAVLLGASLTMLLRHVELHKNMTELKESNQTVVILNSRMMRIEAALREESQFERLAKFNDVMGAITQTRLLHPDLSDLIQWRTDRLFDQALEAHAELSGGIIVIDDEHKELNTNEILLRTLAKREIKAVSFEDETFWSSPEGREFLTAHQEIIQRRKVTVRRLFVLSQPVETYRSTLLKQVAAGVEVKTISPDRTPPVKPEDFVIYDESILRTGYSRPDAPAGGLHKFACITWQKRRVDSYIEAFDSLWRRAEPFVGDA